MPFVEGGSNIFGEPVETMRRMQQALMRQRFRTQLERGVAFV